jgi:hypothetical protein
MEKLSFAQKFHRAIGCNHPSGLQIERPVSETSSHIVCQRCGIVLGGSGTITVYEYYDEAGRQECERLIRTEGGGGPGGTGKITLSANTETQKAPASR